MVSRSNRIRKQLCSVALVFVLYSCGGSSSDHYDYKSRVQYLLVNTEFADNRLTPQGKE